MDRHIPEELFDVAAYSSQVPAQQPRAHRTSARRRRRPSSKMPDRASAGSGALGHQRHRPQNLERCHGSSPCEDHQCRTPVPAPNEHSHYPGHARAGRSGDSNQLARTGAGLASIACPFRCAFGHLPGRWPSPLPTRGAAAMTPTAVDDRLALPHPRAYNHGCFPSSPNAAGRAPLMNDDGSVTRWRSRRSPPASAAGRARSSARCS
jgi:hypothetical protein